MKWNSAPEGAFDTCRDRPHRGHHRGDHPDPRTTDRFDDAYDEDAGRPPGGPRRRGRPGPYGGGMRAGHHHGGGMRGRGRRRRAGRGEVRTAILHLLTEQPMHGYQLMQAIADRTQGRWEPSPGAVYPAINQLEDEGLVRVSAESGRRLVTLTEQGRETAETHRAERPDPFAQHGPTGPDPGLRDLLDEIRMTVRQIARGAVPAQTAAAAAILTTARRDLYLLLANAVPAPAEQTASDDAPAEGAAPPAGDPSTGPTTTT